MSAETTTVPAKPRIRDIVTQPRMLAVMLLGGISGLPNQMSESILQAWFTDLGFTNTKIGLLMYVSLPYLLKPLWAPFLDRFSPPWLGRRRGWLLMFQLIMAASIAALAGVGAETSLSAIAGLLFFVVVLSASQDIVIDAYRTDISKPAERGIASAAANVGYRTTSWGSLAIALVVADYFGWPAAFLTLAAITCAFVLATMWAPEPEDPRGTKLPTFAESVTIPLKELFGVSGVIALVLLIICYKIGDAFAMKFFTAFLLNVGFTKTEVGLVVKAVLVTGSVVGAIAGGLWMVKLGLRRAMFLFAIVQAMTNLGYLLLVAFGKNYVVMVGAVALDALAGGMGNIASVALIMALCDKRFSAFQYALLSVMALLPRYTLSGPAGQLADIGWSEYYWTSFALALPGVALVWILRKRIDALDAAQPR